MNRSPIPEYRGEHVLRVVSPEFPFALARPYHAKVVYTPSHQARWSVHLVIGVRRHDFTNGLGRMVRGQSQSLCGKHASTLDWSSPHPEGHVVCKGCLKAMRRHFPEQFDQLLLVDPNTITAAIPPGGPDRRRGLWCEYGTGDRTAAIWYRMASLPGGRVTIGEIEFQVHAFKDADCSRFEFYEFEPVGSVSRPTALEGVRLMDRPTQQSLTPVLGPGRPRRPGAIDLQNAWVEKGTTQLAWQLRLDSVLLSKVHLVDVYGWYDDKTPAKEYAGYVLVDRARGCRLADTGIGRERPTLETVTRILTRMARTS